MRIIPRLRALSGFRFRSIQSRITVIVSFLLAFVLAVTSLNSYSLTSEAVEGNSRQYIAELMKQVKVNILSYIDNMEQISQLALTNRDVKYYLSDTSFITEEARRPYEKRISDLFQTIMITRTDIASIMLIGYNGRFVSDRRVTSLNPYADIQSKLWYTKAVEAGGTPVISPPHVQNIIQNEYRWVVSLSRELKSADGMMGEGLFLVDLNLSVIDEICSQIRLGKRGYVFIVDEDGHIVYHPQQQLIYSGIKEELIDEVTSRSSGSFITDTGEKRIYTIEETGFGWKLIGVAYMSELIENKGVIQLSYVLLMLIGMVIAVLISYVISKRLSHPIKRLQSSMRVLERGDFNIRADIVSVDEIGQLARTFNVMVGKIKELMHQAIKDQEIKRKNELRLLQAQINPHFLYNTLDSIIWMAERKKHSEVVEMTASLARLFRSSIQKEAEWIPVFVEKEHITNYLRIQKIRYKDRLDYRIEIDDAVLECRMPRILLQPFVENAIYHGIKNKEGMGTVIVKGHRAKEELIFEIVDDGVGIAPDKLRSLLQSKERPPSKRGIGIANVNERIKLFYGGGGICISSELGVGTKITIRLPMCHEEETAHA